MRVYQTKDIPDEIFFVGDRLCHRDIVEYIIEPETMTEITKVEQEMHKLVDKDIRVYLGSFTMKKIERVDGVFMLSSRPIYIIQLKREDTREKVEDVLKQLLRDINEK